MTGPEHVADALRGPWIACLSDGDGFVYSRLANVEDGDYVNISVVRGTAAPVDDRLPGSYDPRDTLYQHDAFDAPEDGAEIAERWAQAQAIAAALNALATAPAEPPGPADADGVWVAAPMNGADMHRLVVGESRRTGCDKAAYGGRETTAANAMQRWASKPCRRCWPVTT